MLSRREFLRNTLAGAAAAATAPALAAEAPAPARPNVVWLMSEDNSSH